MKKYIQSMMAFAAIVSFASCSSEDNTTIENESAAKLMTFTATQEGDEQSTRAAISTDDSKVINWEEGDQISIFDGTKNNQFTLKDGAETNSATFGGEAETADIYTAVYPYQSDATLSGTSVENVTLKATQTATDNSFDKEAALMIAEGDNTTLTFKNVVGYVKVKPNFDCTRIDLKAFDNSAVLAGKGTVSYNGGEPTLDLSNAPTKDYAITLEGDIKENKYYYIAVPPVTLKAGWTIKFTANDGKVYSRKGTKDIIFTRNKVIDLGEFDINVTNWYEPSGSVTSDQEVDLGLTITIGTKNYKVIFANANLTKEGLAEKETDFGDYFAWGAKEPWLTSYTYSGSGFTDDSFTNKTWKEGYSTDGYAWSNVPFKDDSSNSCNKYINTNDVLAMSDDAANVILGGDWQIPTYAIWYALVKMNNLTTKGFNSERKGYEFVNNGQALFLPAAGYVSGSSFSSVGSVGDYWSGTASSSLLACRLFFNRSDLSTAYLENRCDGFPVRPVRLVEE